MHFERPDSKRESIDSFVTRLYIRTPVADPGDVRGSTPLGGPESNLFFMSIINNSCLTLMVAVVCSLYPSSVEIGTGCIGLIFAACTQPPRLYPNIPCQSRSLGRSDTPPPPDIWRPTFYASSVIFSSKCRPVECRKSALLTEAHDCKIPPGEHALGPPPPLSARAPLVRRCLDHDVWKGPLSDKYDPPPFKGWLPACLLPCY